MTVPPMPETCGCDHPHQPGTTFCYVCELPVEASAWLLAAKNVRLCDFCEDRHFRADPDEASYACFHLGCECWCMDNTKQVMQ